MSAPSAQVAPAAHPGITRTQTAAILPAPALPASAPPLGESHEANMVLELADGSAHSGISFGAEGKSISGECVFQTGESRTNLCFAS